MISLTIEQKKAILTEINNLSESLHESADVESEDFGFNVTLRDFEEDIVKILKIAGVDGDLDISLSMEYIIENCETLTLDDLDELKEVDNRIFDNGETKYKYTEFVFDYNNTGVLHKFTIQQTADGGIDLTTIYNGIVQKKEITSIIYS